MVSLITAKYGIGAWQTTLIGAVGSIIFTVNRYLSMNPYRKEALQASYQLVRQPEER